MPEIVGVRFSNSVKTYYFDPAGLDCQKGTAVIVNTARGVEYAKISFEKRTVNSSLIVSELKPIIRIATQEDWEINEKNIMDAKQAHEICIQKISDHKLPMKLINSEYTFDRAKLIFHFTSETRVDFRSLVRDLAAIFRTRIELRQVGVRDKAKQLGGYGICGKEYCCMKWMQNFNAVTIKMAKDQGLTLNPAKISGACDRLYCCLAFEEQQYEGILKIMPGIGSIVSTPDGIGKVVHNQMMLKEVKVVFDTEDNVEFKTYPLDKIKVVRYKREASDKTQDANGEFETIED